MAINADTIEKIASVAKLSVRKHKEKLPKDEREKVCTSKHVSRVIYVSNGS